MMIKHNILMTTEEYFAVKNYLIKLKSQGKLDNDVFMQKFYKSFAIESSIKIDRKQKIFDNPEVSVVFYLDNNHTLLSTIGLFCREHSIDVNREQPMVARALRKIKDYISTELLDIFNL
jgi:hypothetical protein